MKIVLVIAGMFALIAVATTSHAASFGLSTLATSAKKSFDNEVFIKAEINDALDTFRATNEISLVLAIEIAHYRANTALASQMTDDEIAEILAQ